MDYFSCNSVPDLGVFPNTPKTSIAQSSDDLGRRVIPYIFHAKWGAEDYGLL